MEEEKKPIVRRPRPNVLKKLNTENLLLIERGLLGDLPDSLKPNYIPPGPVRGNSELVVSKPSGFSCIPVKLNSPTSEKIPFGDDVAVSPLKKSFSFREKFSKIGFLGKHKNDKHKWKTDENKVSEKNPAGDESKRYNKAEHEFKSNKRFWLFRNKEIDHNNRSNRPVYKRSKSFEFLPRAIEEETKEEENIKGRMTNSFSYYGSNDMIENAAIPNESTEIISEIYNDNDNVFLKSIRELPTDYSKHNTSLSIADSESSNGGGNIDNTLGMFKGQSVQNILEEFNKTVDLFSEAYVSDCEPYTKSTKEQLREKRKSSSFSAIPSPKVIHVSTVSEASEDFKKELSQILSVKRASVVKCRSSRRGSLTDFFLLEDKAVCGKVVLAPTIHEDNKYRRAQKKPMNRVRRMSSTKYVSTTLNFFDKKLS